MGAIADVYFLNHYILDVADGEEPPATFDGLKITDPAILAVIGKTQSSVTTTLAVSIGIHVIDITVFAFVDQNPAMATIVGYDVPDIKFAYTVCLNSMTAHIVKITVTYSQFFIPVVLPGSRWIAVNPHAYASMVLYGNVMVF